MSETTLLPMLEALLFAAEEPLTAQQLLNVLNMGKDETARLEKKVLLEALTHLQANYAENTHGLELVEVNHAYQFRTKPHYASWIQELNKPKPSKLSKPAMESLAVIAYRQPLCRHELEEIRGVDSGAVVKSLLERELIKIVGRKEEPGRPILYGTAPGFLELFGLKDLNELPPLRDIEEQAQRLMEQAKELNEQELQHLEGFKVELEALEWLDEREKETFAELDSCLDELKVKAEQANQLINPETDAAATEANN